MMVEEKEEENEDNTKEEDDIKFCDDDKNVNDVVGNLPKFEA